MIYDSKPGAGILPENLKPQQGFSLDKKFGDSAVKGLDSSIALMAKLKSAEQTQAATNLDNLTEMRDNYTNMRIDNPLQKEAIDAAKKDTNLENVFSTVGLESLKQPYGAKIVENTYKNFLRDPRIEAVQREQVYANKYKTDIEAIDDPVLRKMAIDDYMGYREGKISGDKLSADQYQPMDLSTVIGAKFAKIVPKVSEKLVRDNQNKATYVESIKQRDKKSMDLTFEAMLSDPAFVNNLAARGYYDKQTGTLTPEGTNYKDALAEQYSIQDLKDKNVHYDKQFRPDHHDTTTHTGTSTNTYTSTRIGEAKPDKNGNVKVRVTYPDFATKTQITKLDAAGQKLVHFGIDPGQYSLFILNPGKNKDGKVNSGQEIIDDVVKVAMKDPDQSALLMMHKLSGMKMQDLAKDWADGSFSDLKKLDKTIKDFSSKYYNKLTAEEKKTFNTKAYNEAKAWLEAHPEPTAAPTKAYKGKPISKKEADIFK